MKEIKNIKSEVYLSTYDNSDLLLPVSEEHKDIENICVAVKFNDILIKISPKTTCNCSWYEATKKHHEELMSSAYWQMVGNVSHEVNQTLQMLGHDPLGFVWTDTDDRDPQFSGHLAWYYYGAYGCMGTLYKYYSSSVRATLVFQL